MKLKFPIDIEEMTVHVHGDPSVGICSLDVSIKNMGLTAFDQEDLTSFKSTLLEAFKSIYDSRVDILTKQEEDLIEKEFEEVEIVRINPLDK